MTSLKFLGFLSITCCVLLQQKNFKNYGFLYVGMVSKRIAKKKKSNESIKRELLNSLQENDDV